MKKLGITIYELRMGMRGRAFGRTDGRAFGVGACKF